MYIVKSVVNIITIKILQQHYKTTTMISNTSMEILEIVLHDIWYGASDF